MLEEYSLVYSKGWAFPNQPGFISYPELKNACYDTNAIGLRSGSIADISGLGKGSRLMVFLVHNNEKQKLIQALNKRGNTVIDFDEYGDPQHREGIISRATRACIKSSNPVTVWFYRQWLFTHNLDIPKHDPVFGRPIPLHPSDMTRTRNTPIRSASPIQTQQKSQLNENQIEDEMDLELFTTDEEALKSMELGPNKQLGVGHKQPASSYSTKKVSFSNLDLQNPQTNVERQNSEQPPPDYTQVTKTNQTSLQNSKPNMDSTKELNASINNNNNERPLNYNSVGEQ